MIYCLLQQDHTFTGYYSQSRFVYVKVYKTGRQAPNGYVRGSG